MAYQSFWVIYCQSHPGRKTVVALLNPSLVGIKTFIAFPRVSVNVIVPREFERAYYHLAVQRFSYYAMGIPLIGRENKNGINMERSAPRVCVFEQYVTLNKDLTGSMRPELFTVNTFILTPSHHNPFVDSPVNSLEYADCTPYKGAIHNQQKRGVSWLSYWTASQGKVPDLEFWGVWITSSWPLLPDPRLLRIVVTATLSYMGKIDLFENYLIKSLVVCAQINCIRIT